MAYLLISQEVGQFFALWASGCGTEYLNCVWGQCEHQNQNVPSDRQTQLAKQQSFPMYGSEISYPKPAPVIQFHQWLSRLWALLFLRRSSLAR